MSYYLLDHKPASTQSRSPRRAKLSGRVVLHDSASALDRIAPDTGAENVAGFISRRTDAGSYHELGDSDSGIVMLPDDVEAFGALNGVNHDAWHICIAANPDDMDPENDQTVSMIRWMGHRIVAFWQRNGFPTDARFITAGDGATFGLIHHGDLQADRSDAWARHPQRAALDAMLLAEIFVAAGGFQPEEDDMPAVLKQIAYTRKGSKWAKEMIGSNEVNHAVILYESGLVKYVASAQVVKDLDDLGVPVLDGEVSDELLRSYAFAGDRL